LDKNHTGFESVQHIVEDPLSVIDAIAIPDKARVRR
jgi:hypothetical protein